MKEKLTCCIIDDEHLAQVIMEKYVAKVPFLELKGTFNSPLEAAAQLNNDMPDLLFLDITMPDLDGLSFITMLNPQPMIILTTAYDQYALQAFELEVNDYMLKPFSFERFYKGVLRLFHKQNFKPHPEKTDLIAEPKQEHIFLKVGHRIQKVATGDIILVEGMKDYLRIHTSSEKIMTLLSFAKLEELLPSQDFARVHRSFIVAIDKIDHIEKNRIMIAQLIIPIGNTYSESFFNKLRGI